MRIVGVLVIKAEAPFKAPALIKTPNTTKDLLHQVKKQQGLNMKLNY